MFQARAKGFILVITIGIIGLLSSIVVRTVTKLTAFTALNGVLIKREQAKLFAISGIEFAISRLLTIYNPETDTSRTDKGENGIQKDPAMATIQLQKAMSSLLNRWHTIPLTEAVAYADGTITLYIACEQGKIDIRSLYEHTNNEYKESLKLKLLKKPINDYFTQQIKDFNITTILKNIAQKKNGLHNLSDITQVFAQKQNTSLYRTLFLEPQSKMALYDLFSLEELETKPVPILAMSRSVATLFGLQIKNSISNKEWEDYAKLYKKQPADTAALIDAQLKLIYGKTIDFKGLITDNLDISLKPKQSSGPDELLHLFSETFEANQFSVISYGTYGNTTVRIYAIVEIRDDSKKDGKKRKSVVLKKYIGYMNNAANSAAS